MRGFSCQFTMTAPEEIMQIAYDGGIGGKNSIGFGMIREVENEKRN
ncbi:MAG: CRISPR-associated endoribonuclease Cas6 [Dysgonamonadaceae bacterium]